jgi:ribonuclease PH
VEVQGTGEESTYQREELDALLDMADIGFSNLFEMQKSILHGQE